MKKEWDKYLKLGVTVFLLFLSIYYWNPFAKLIGVILKAAAPLLAGCIIAYIVNVIMSLYERHYFPKHKNVFVKATSRPICLLGALLTMGLIVVAVVLVIIPQLAICIQLMFEEVPVTLQSLTDSIAKTAWLPEALGDNLKSIDWKGTITKLFNIVTSGIGSTIDVEIEAVTSMVTFVINIIIGAVFSIYLLFSKERLQEKSIIALEKFVRPEWAKKVQNFLSIANTCFRKYIVGQCLEAIILGGLCSVGMHFIGFPYAFVTGTVVGVTALIPVVGAYIGGAVGYLLILSKSPIQALLFFVFLIILQQLEYHLIYPRVVGSSVGLPGIWVIAVVTIGGGIFGITGMLIGVPLAAAVYQTIRRSNEKEEEQTAAEAKEVRSILAPQPIMKAEYKPEVKPEENSENKKEDKKEDKPENRQNI